MKRKQLLLISLLTCLSFQYSFAQNDAFQGWLKEFQNYQTELPTEKVFLHLDKSEYTLGETIWIKSYLVAGAGHIPSPFSQTVYVELLDEQNELVQRLTLRSEEGVSKANITLQKDMQPGFYYLRGYTNWMKNQGEEFFFNKKIKVHSLEINGVITEKAIPRPLEVKFYPEGGDLIQDVASKVAFEVTGLKDEQLPISGKIFNAEQNEVATFTTQHESRGVFAMLPSNTNYYAQLNGSEEKFQLPEIKTEGVTLSINNEAAEFMGVAIKTAKPSAEKYYLMVHTRGYVTYASEITIRNPKNLLKVDKSNLPNGVSHVTVFNKDLQPMAERLVFNYAAPEVNIDISTTNPQYASRDLATINLKVTDNEGKPVQGSFSMSVFDSKLVQNDQLDYNITANLLLSSDISGYIKNPSQYLKQDEASIANSDLLMMVNGWRRFKWSTLDMDNREPIYDFEQALKLKGKMTKSGGKPFKNGRIFLLNLEENGNHKGDRFVLADQEGRFEFDNLTYYDTTDLTLQGFQKSKVKDAKFEIDKTFEKLPLNRYLTQSLRDNPDRVRALKENAITSIRIDSTYRKENGIIYLDDVYVTASKREERHRTLNSQYGKGEAYVNFDNMSFEEKNGRDPFTAMLGKLSGFSLSTASGGNSGGVDAASSLLSQSASRAPVGGSSNDVGSANDPIFRQPRLRQGPYQGAPLILIDNIPVPYTAVYDLRATEIDYVEVYKSASAAMFGVNGSNGAIAFYTLKGDKLKKAIAMKPGMRMISGNGYHAAREFYAPKYDESNKQQFIPDERSTLFWAPMITTGIDGKAQVEFYTHDKNTNVFIDIQGISANGKVGTGVSQFNIRRNY